MLKKVSESVKTVYKKVGVPLTLIVIAIVMFTGGVLVGQGRISFGAHQGVTGLPSQLDYTTLNQEYQALRANYNGKLTQTQLLDGLKHGLADATNDPYTEYFTASEAKDFNNELNNSFSGVGAELGQDSSGNLVVISPISGFPADKAGLKPQDILSTINGQSTNGLSVDQAVNEIRGKSGTTVTLGVVRGSQQITFTITRENIQLPSVNTKILSGNIGYMQITTFANDTAQLSQKAADSFKQQNVNGIILDLRDDPGGLLDAAVSVSSLWVPEGNTIVQEKGTTGDVIHTAQGGDELNGIPTVVLINNGSASASEITAGALHDNKVATLIGEKSYGKGVVQQLINLSGGSQLKVTVASWYRPNGQNINKQGITPDQTVTMTSTDLASGNDLQLNAAEAYLTK